MPPDSPFEIFLVAAPGTETVVCNEARNAGFARAQVIKGGVTFDGGWPDVWRANLLLRCPSRVLARMVQFRALHLAQLDKRARKVPWRQVLRADRPFRVEASCSASRIYHSDAAAQRIERAIHDTLGAAASPEADLCIKARIEDDLCTIGIDTSGELLHKRGHKLAVSKAPMRENLAACFLAMCGYDGSEPVLDPMCGSGTFVIEAAEIAARFAPGRSRSFAFEQLATFDAAFWQELRAEAGLFPAQPAPSGSTLHPVPIAKEAGTIEPQTELFASPLSLDEGQRERLLRPLQIVPSPKNLTLNAPAPNFYGSDHDAGAVRMSVANAARSGLSGLVHFQQTAIGDLLAPDGPPGLVIVNPPYGERIGDRGHLNALYAALGQALRARFAGWRIGVITNEPALAKATGLAFSGKLPPVSHGGLRVTLYQTDPLA